MIAGVANEIKILFSLNITPKKNGSLSDGLDNGGEL